MNQKQELEIARLKNRIQDLEGWMRVKATHTGDCYGAPCFCGYFAILHDRFMTLEERDALNYLHEMNERERQKAAVGRSTKIEA